MQSAAAVSLSPLDKWYWHQPAANGSRHALYLQSVQVTAAYVIIKRSYIGLDEYLHTL